MKMSFLSKNFCNFLYRKLEIGIQAQQVRHRFLDWRMLKDHKKRKSIEEHGEERLRLNAIRKNKILPPELQALADEEIAALPVYSSRSRIKNRCIVTSRSKGNVKYYKVSRIVFRHLADYNFLSGWQRAMW